jgi:hypothetical protein
MSSFDIPVSITGLVLLAALSSACARDAGNARPSESRDAASVVAPCVVTGSWDAVLERPGYRVHGVVTLDAPSDSGRVRVGSKPRGWRGRYDLEWWRLWGLDEGQLQSTSTGAGSQDEIRYGLLAYADGDTISITLSPLTSHGPISLWGLWHGDTIRGEWGQRSYPLPPLPGATDSARPPHGTALLTRSPTVCAKRAALYLQKG